MTAGPAFGLAPRVLDRRGALLGRAALGTLPALPATRSLAVIGFAVIGFAVIGFAVIGLDVISRGGIGRVIGRFVDDHFLGQHPGITVLGSGTGTVAIQRRLGHGSLRDSALACNAEMISGPSNVTSPAPIVTTTSPGRTAAATCSATVDRSGR